MRPRLLVPVFLLLPIARMLAACASPAPEVSGPDAGIAPECSADDDCMPGPCSLGACVAGSCSYAVLSGVECTIDGGEGVCEYGACRVVIRCESAEECPLRTCADRACSEGVCSYVRAADGAPCVAGSCSAGSCVSPKDPA